MKLPNIFEKNTAPVFYPAGSTIFETGQPRDAMFIVQEGEVEIKVGHKTVETVKVDEFFGEMALIDGGIRSASAVHLAKVFERLLLKKRAPLRSPFRRLNGFRVPNAPCGLNPLHEFV